MGISDDYHTGTIDDIGIPPDYYLDTIPQYKWVEFIAEALNQ
jgi:hypothetical protein